MTEEKKSSLHETSRLLCETYRALLEKGEVSFELSDEHVFKVDSAVKTVYSNFFGVERFPTDEEKAAAFFCYIIKDHVFTGGNKRSATLWLETFSTATGLTIDPNVPIDVLAVSVEQTDNGAILSVIELVKIILFERVIERTS